jgi:diphthamide biosynthesis protein 2
MISQPIAPPVLSTPDTHIFEDPTPISNIKKEPRLSDERVYEVYEVERTVREVKEGGWRRVALQFPDGMLGDAPRVFQKLEEGLKALPLEQTNAASKENGLEQSFNELSTTDTTRHKLYILGDTSYGACCVDEIAAEHVDAEVVVHYGRSCLSPTARLPVVYVFTRRPLPLEPVLEVFQTTYPGKEEKVVLMADIVFHNHIPPLLKLLREKGYTNILAPEIIHDPSSLIPNRRLDIEEVELKEYPLFHISDPPPALLLTLSSRVRKFHIYPSTRASERSSSPPATLQSNTRIALRRRYALLTSLSTCSIFGILINTLSVRNYLETVSTVKQMIERAGKKSYTFVVGKVNAAKLSNFGEIGGWVVVGCWESSLVESGDFFKGVITPSELQLALQSDEERVWKGDWRGDFEGLSTPTPKTSATPTNANTDEQELDEGRTNGEAGDLDSEEESAPPEFDLRTGRYVSHSRPLRATTTKSAHMEIKEDDEVTASNVLTRRARQELATVNGAVSPGAEYLRSQRTWTGLGSDFHEEAGTQVEEGRRGVARGYMVGDGVGERR